jgi:hypothetical protein
MNEPPDPPLQGTLDNLVSVTPVEDAGAETAARYRFQADVIARDAIAVLVRGSGAVVCEWHEDAIVFDGEDVELLSVKHRELTQGPWTEANLVADGGLKHLFERWRDTGRRARCRLATNAGLNRAAAKLRDAVAGGDAISILPIAKRLAKSLGTSEDDAVAFLTKLRIEDQLPNRTAIAVVNVARFMQPALVRLRLSSLDAAKAYEAIVVAVQDASRDRTENSAELLDLIAEPKRLDSSVKRRRKLATRTLLPEMLRDNLSEARSSRVRLKPVAEPATALEQKLRKGGLGPTAVRSAQVLRASWTNFEAALGDQLGGVNEELVDLGARIGRVAADAELEAMVNPAADGTWGRAMYSSVMTRLRAGAFAAWESLPVDDALVEGYLFELTDRCRVWWSDEFELAKA